MTRLKVIVVTLFLSVLVRDLWAQKVEIGVKGGLNFSDFRIEVGDMYSRYLVGGYARFHPAKKLGIQSELLYTIEGSDRLKYLSIPLLAKYFFNSEIYVLAGPQVYIPLGSQPNNGEPNFEHYLEKNFAIVSGIGLDMFTGMGISLRYVRSMIPADLQKRDQHMLQVSVSLELN